MKRLASLVRTTAVLLTSLVLLSGCRGEDGSSTGTLRLSITDQPACGYDNVFITVERVRVHQSENAGDADSGWQQIVLDPARRIDLLTLTNGVLEELGQTALPAGEYTQMRLVLASNSAHPMANSVVPTGSSEVELTTPSGQQTGLKMNVSITVEPDKVADFVIDFDACKSVVVAGSSGKYNLKPVVSVIPVLSDAGQRIVGYVDAAPWGGRSFIRCAEEDPPSEKRYHPARQPSRITASAAPGAQTATIADGSVRRRSQAADPSPAPPA
jgi:hypothetical protein